MTNFLDYHQHVGTNPDKVFKTTLFQSMRLLVGINCLEPGQTQAIHKHDDQDKFYFVVEGEGYFTVGDESQTAGEGCSVWAAAGVQHGVTNPGDQRLVLLVGFAPGSNIK